MFKDLQSFESIEERRIQHLIDDPWSTSQTTFENNYYYSEGKKMEWRRCYGNALLGLETLYDALVPFDVQLHRWSGGCIIGPETNCKVSLTSGSRSSSSSSSSGGSSSLSSGLSSTYLHGKIWAWFRIVGFIWLCSIRNQVKLSVPIFGQIYWIITRNIVTITKNFISSIGAYQLWWNHLWWSLLGPFRWSSHVYDGCWTNSVSAVLKPVNSTASGCQWRRWF